MKLLEILKAQGLTDEQIKSIQASMKENKVYETSLENADERYSKLKTQKDDLKSQLDTANTTIEDLKKNNKDNETLQNTIKEHETTIENLKKEAEIKDFNYALDTALKESRCKNTKAIKALLNMDDIKLNEGKFEGLKEQINSLKESDSYLFEQEYNQGSKGFNPGSSSQTITKEDFNKMGYSERVKLYSENRELYNNLNQ